MSFKAEIKTLNDPKFYTNNLRFPTELEALCYARDLHAKWMASEQYRVAECSDPPTHRWDGKLVPLKEFVVTTR